MRLLADTVAAALLLAGCSGSNDDDLFADSVAAESGDVALSSNAQPSDDPAEGDDQAASGEPAGRSIAPIGVDASEADLTATETAALLDAYEGYLLLADGARSRQRPGQSGPGRHRLTCGAGRYRHLARGERGAGRRRSEHRRAADHLRCRHDHRECRDRHRPRLPGSPTRRRVPQLHPIEFRRSADRVQTGERPMGGRCGAGSPRRLGCVRASGVCPQTPQGRTRATPARRRWPPWRPCGPIRRSGPTRSRA